MQDQLGLGIHAVTENSQGLALRTCLGQSRDGHGRFEMIEHVMAALAGLGVHNVQVNCTSSEMPGLDGSCLAIVNAIEAAGTTLLPASQPTLVIDQTIKVGQASSWISIQPANQYQVEYHLDYGLNSPIAKCSFSSAITPDLFARQIAPARTFVTRAEAIQLQSQGLARHVTDRDLLVFDETGPSNNSLRFDEECARHKALDVIGDLALTGIDLVGKVVAHRSGHQLNAQLAMQLREIYLRQLAGQPVPRAA
jgi:UDP-3-O-acyl-N-acetylglucosamine deacetylase